MKKSNAIATLLLKIQIEVLTSSSLGWKTS